MASDKPKCGAHGKQLGTPCKKPAGWGTDHVGEGRCRIHGGNTPNGRKQGQRLLAAAAAVTYGLPIEVDPTTALLQEIHRTAGHVAWLASMIKTLEPDHMIFSVTEAKNVKAAEWKGVDVTWSAKEHVWIQLYQTERKHLAGVCAAAIKAGVQERQVRVMEQQAEMVSNLLNAVFGRLELTSQQQAAVLTIVPEELAKVAS